MSNSKVKIIKKINILCCHETANPSCHEPTDQSLQLSLLVLRPEKNGWFSCPTSTKLDKERCNEQSYAWPQTTVLSTMQKNIYLSFSAVCVSCQLRSWDAAIHRTYCLMIKAHKIHLPSSLHNNILVDTVMIAASNLIMRLKSKTLYCEYSIE